MSSDKVQKATTFIEKAEKDQHNVSSERLHSETEQLRKSELGGHNLSASEWQQVDTKLHQDGVLPHVDIVGLGDGDTGIRGISTPTKGPNGQESLVTKAHGTLFTYDSEGHVQSWSKNGDTWSYNSNDGLYHESLNGKNTAKTSDDVVTMTGSREVATHPDGSTTTTAAWGGTIDRNAQGQMIKEANGHDVKTFQWNGTTLTSLSDQQNGQQAVTYTRGSDGKYYAADDPSHQNPLDITVEANKNADGTPIQDGVVSFSDKNGNTTDVHWGGEQVKWNSEHELTEIDYSNGNKATGFTYDAAPLSTSSQNPVAPVLTGFKTTDKNGQTHSYSFDASTGLVSIDGGQGVKGTLSNDSSGNLTVTQTGDGTDAQYKSIDFSTNGSEVTTGKFGGQIKTEGIVNWAGHTSTFSYDSQGNLTSIDTPYGPKLTKQGNQWVDASGQPAGLTPYVDANGNFSIVKPDGTYATWGAGGTMVEGIPDTPQAIAAESQQAKQLEEQEAAGQQQQQQQQQQQPPPPPSEGSGNNSAGNGSFNAGNSVEYKTSESDRTSQQMTIDTDGSQSYGSLDPSAINFVALNPGWAQNHGVHPGAVVAVRSNGHTQYAVYADNSSDSQNYTQFYNSVHTEGSPHLSEGLGDGGNNVPTADFYASTTTSLNLSGLTQAQIDQAGQNAFGVAPS